MSRRKRILIIDDDQGIHVVVKHVLKPHYDCSSAYTCEEAKVLLSNNGYELVLLDMNISYENEGLDFLPVIKGVDPELDVVIASTNAQRDLVGKAVEKGAAGWLVKEFSSDQLITTVESVIQRRALLAAQEHQSRTQKRNLGKSPLIGTSKAIKTLIQTIEKVRATNVNVLIMGETGTGKELVARHIGAINGKSFVPVDSSTITSSMAESMLFGHEKGAFTGATETSRGLFEEANSGSIYFDEIGNMPLEIQAKLLRVVQEKEITRLGSRKVIPLEFRVICATNLDLEAMAEKGLFKYDLLQRINVVPIRLSPLRERPEDVPLLIEHFLNVHNPVGAAKSFSKDALEALTAYHWPGNVRELSNVVAYLYTMIGNQETIEIEDLPEKIQLTIKSRKPSAAPKELTGVAEALAVAMNTGDTDFYGYMALLECKVLEELYKKFNGNISQLSKAIKVSRSHLYSKLNTHGIHK